DGGQSKQRCTNLEGDRHQKHEQAARDDAALADRGGGAFGHDAIPQRVGGEEGNSLGRGLSLAPRGSRRDVSRHAALPGVNSLAMFEAGQTAGRDGTLRRKAGKPEAHGPSHAADGYRGDAGAAGGSRNEVPSETMAIDRAPR